jgi:hypothetical protein
MKGLDMEAFHEYVEEYRRQLALGAIRPAYRGLMEYMMALRTHFKNGYPDHFVSGSIYYGYMDMTYFSFIPKELKARNLKTAIVLIHDTLSFEVWLARYNKKAQSEYWKLFRESGWDKHHIVSNISGVDYIMKHVVVDKPDFSDLETLTRQMESATLKFIEDVESFLSEH